MRSLCGIVLALLTSVAHGQTFTWNGGAGTGTWSSSGNWSSLPVSGASTRIVFAGTLQPNTNQNLGSPFELNELIFANGAAAWTISGNDLRVIGPAAMLTLDSANPATIHTNLVLNQTLQIVGGVHAAGLSAGDLRITGIVSGVGGLRIAFTNPVAHVALTHGANTFTGAAVIQRGTLSLQSSGAIASAGSIAVGSQASFLLDNTAAVNANRIGNSAPVTLAGGELTLLGHFSLTTAESTGALNLLNGQSTVDLIPGLTAGTQLSFASLSSGGIGTVVITGIANNLGAAPGAGTANLYFSTTPALSGGGGASGTPNISILPRVLVSGGPSGDAVTLSTYGTHGVRALTASEFAPSISSGTATTENVRLSATVLALSAHTARNSLVLPSDFTFVSIGPGASLTLASGELVNLGQENLITGTGTLAFSQRAHVTVEGGTKSLTIETPISVAGNAGFVKAGIGTLTLSSSATLGANLIAIHAGTLAVESNAVVSSSPVVRVAHGASLDVTSIPGGWTLSAGQTLRGEGTVLGTVRVGANAIVDPQDGLDGPGTLTLGHTTWLPGGRYRWRISDVRGLETQQSRLAGTGNLDLTNLNAANRFIILVTSLNENHAPGSVSNFNSASDYSWTIASYGSISGFSADKFTIDSSAFTNSLDGGQFTLSQSGNTLVLNFVTAIPEPSSGVLAVAAIIVLRRSRKRRFANQIHENLAS